MLVHIWWWVQHILGVDAPGSRAYNFWSGFGSDISEFAIFAGLIGIYRKHNCHVKGCWRIGKHAVNNTPFVTCQKHHPTIDKDITSNYIQNEHRRGKYEVTK